MAARRTEHTKPKPGAKVCACGHADSAGIAQQHSASATHCVVPTSRCALVVDWQHQQQRRHKWHSHAHTEEAGIGPGILC